MKNPVTEQYKRWEEERVKPSLANAPERKTPFATDSGINVERLYVRPESQDRLQIEFPGEYPFTRGIYPAMYRNRLWTMRQYAGFGTAEESNRRYHYLTQQGTTGLSVAFDLPTQVGYDSDHPLAEGEVGKVGVAIDTLADMETLFDGIRLDKVTTSMTINATAATLLCMYVAVAKRQGVNLQTISGTIQNDILKEYIAQKEWIFPPEPSMRMITDLMAFCAQHVPRWNSISISGYHIREAGSTAIQELAFTLADGFAYVEAGMKAGQDVDVFAPRLSFFFNSHLDFFEEIAKYRAARRIWARHMREKYGAKKKESWLMRFHTQTAGCSLTAQQPENNIIRTAYEALAAVLGGTQSLHTNSMDETWALPSEKAVQIALRTQQIIACESGVANTIDPLAGSYFVETMTNKMEEGAERYFKEIEKRGGVLKCIENGYFQKEIADAAARFQREIDAKERIIVGVNGYLVPGEELAIPILKIPPEVEQEQRACVQSVRKERDNDKAKRTLGALKNAAKGNDNVMPKILDCARCYVTEGEMAETLKEVFGTYTEEPVF